MGDNYVGPGHLGCNCADSQLIWHNWFFNLITSSCFEKFVEVVKANFKTHPSHLILWIFWGKFIIILNNFVPVGRLAGFPHLWWLYQFLIFYVITFLNILWGLSYFDILWYVFNVIIWSWLLYCLSILFTCCINVYLILFWFRHF